ncbi:GNAT family N-acetyltransferase [Robertmurraya beringensis]|jgi:GNAT superfamily N-acetyltransferase|uniref:GNAT family N-acetyltransferase n=1 Tax=Robertmurraya beringensis TaxID=641660 RepID=A0ABV6KXY6_9BACI|nr:transcriptional regulator, MarR family with acetyltransferase activity [Mycobacteroides abscessus subsp. abscessus]
MIIREAKETEIPFIREQRVNAYTEHAEKIPNAHWEALKKAISSDADSQPGVELLVAEVEGTIVGSVALFPAKTDAYEGMVDELDHPEIRVLAVAEEFRGKGIASALIKECIQRSKTKGYQAIGLHTGEFMTNAIKLYKHFGFERLPQYDFEPANDGIIVKAFRLSI